jgi:hypothetical protein
MVIGFIELLNTQLMTYNLQITVTHRLTFSVTVFTALLGNVFWQWTFLCSQAHVLAGWRPFHINILLFWLPPQDSYLNFSRLTADRSLSYNHCTDPTNNTSPNSSPIVARRNCRYGPSRKHRFPQLLYCCMFHSRYLETTISAGFRIQALSKYVTI